MSVHHKTSWASLSIAFVVSIYYAVNLIFVLKGDLGLYSLEMMALARNVFGTSLVVQAVMFFINYVSKDEPEDKAIARDVSLRANKAALMFMIAAVACCAVYLIYVSDTKTVLLSPLVSAHLLVSVLLAAWIIKHAVELFIYHRNHQAQHLDHFS